MTNLAQDYADYKHQLYVIYSREYYKRTNRGLNIGFYDGAWSALFRQHEERRQGKLEIDDDVYNDLVVEEHKYIVRDNRVIWTDIQFLPTPVSGQQFILTVRTLYAPLFGKYKNIFIDKIVFCEWTGSFWTCIPNGECMPHEVLFFALVEPPGESTHS